MNLIDSEESQNTPLHWAASFGNRGVIQCLCSMSDISSLNSLILVQLVEGTCIYTHCQLISNRLRVNFSLILNTCKDSYSYNFFPSLFQLGGQMYEL